MLSNWVLTLKGRELLSRQMVGIDAICHQQLVGLRSTAWGNTLLRATTISYWLILTVLQPNPLRARRASVLSGCWGLRPRLLAVHLANFSIALHNLLDHLLILQRSYLLRRSNRGNIVSLTRTSSQPREDFANTPLARQIETGDSYFLLLLFNMAVRTRFLCCWAASIPPELSGTCMTLLGIIPVWMIRFE